MASTAILSAATGRATKVSLPTSATGLLAAATYIRMMGGVPLPASTSSPHSDHDERHRALFDFTRHLIRIRLEHPNLHRRKFNQDRVIRGSVVRDLLWLRTDGEEMTDDEWNAGWVKTLGLMLNGKTLN